MIRKGEERTASLHHVKPSHSGRSYNTGHGLICSVILLVNVLLLPPVMCDRDHLEPSITMLSPEVPGNHYASQLLRNDEEKKISDWEFEDSCRFEAYPGRIFNQSLLETLNKLHPSTCKGDCDITIHIPDTLYNDWLMHNEDFHLIYGVPDRDDTTFHFLLIIHSGRTKYRSLIPCVVDVIPPFFHHGLLLDSDSTSLGCLPRDNIVTFVIVLDAEKDKLKSKDKYDILLALSRFLAELDPSKTSPLTLEGAEQHLQHAFLSGEGNAIGYSKKINKASISWPMSCGTDSINPMVLEKLEAFIKDGSLTKLIGYDVVEWKVENRKPQTSSTYKNRFKRQTNLRGKPSKDAINYPEDHPTFDVEDKKWTKENIYYPQIRRVSVPRGMMKRSPIVRSLEATPIHPQPSQRPLPVQSTPYFPDINSHPERDAGMPDLTVFRSTYVEFAIPKNVFRDREEGDTRFLLLNIQDLSSHNDSWMLLDRRRQLLYGVAPSKSDKTQYDFLLIAQDREGLSVSDHFIVHVNQPPRPVNHRITFYISKFKRNLPINDVTLQLARLLSDALSSGWRAVRPPGHYTFHKVTTSKSKLIVTWFDNSLGSKSECDEEGIGKMSSKMIGRSYDDVTDERETPRNKFKNKFQPNFVIKSVKIILSGPCVENVKMVIDEATDMWSTMESTSLPSSPTTTTLHIPTTSKTTSPRSLTSTTTFKTTTTITTTTLPTTIITTTTTLPTTHPVITLSDPNYVIIMETKFGKIVKFICEKNIFSIEANVGEIGRKINYKLEANVGSIPRWASVDATKGDIFALPLLKHSLGLQRINSTHRVWHGWFYAIDRSTMSSVRIPVKIYVLAPNHETEQTTELSHQFIMTITNFNIQHFTSKDAYGFLLAIQSLYRDSSMENIIVDSMNPGSVVFSWHNGSISKNNLCSNVITQVEEILLDNQEKIRPSITQRFEEVGYDVRSIRLIRADECRSLPPTTSFTQPTTSPKLRHTKSTTSNTTASPVESSGGNSAGILIIITIIICISIILIVILVKWRSHMRRKKLNTKDSASKSNATPLIGNIDANHSFQLKPSPPVLLEGEGEDDSLINKRQNYPNQDQSLSLDNNKDDQIQTRGSATNERPNPPPYSGNAAAS